MNWKESEKSFNSKVEDFQDRWIVAEFDEISRQKSEQEAKEDDDVADHPGGKLEKEAIREPFKTLLRVWNQFLRNFLSKAESKQRNLTKTNKHESGTNRPGTLDLVGKAII